MRAWWDVSVRTQLGVESPGTDFVILLQVTVSRQGDGDGYRPIDLQLCAITGQQMNGDGCNRTQLEPLFCPCRLEKNRAKVELNLTGSGNTQHMAGNYKISDERMRSRMRRQESKQENGRKEETENENTWGGKFQQVCPCSLEDTRDVKRGNEKTRVRAPSFPWGSP